MEHFLLQHAALIDSFTVCHCARLKVPIRQCSNHSVVAELATHWQCCVSPQVSSGRLLRSLLKRRRAFTDSPLSRSACDAKALSAFIAWVKLHKILQCVSLTHMMRL